MGVGVEEGGRDVGVGGWEVGVGVEVVRLDVRVFQEGGRSERWCGGR